MRTKIEWTDVVWNPVRGCTKVSAGCKSCYAERMAARFAGPGLPYDGTIGSGGRWSGEIKFLPDVLVAPLSWRRLRRVFVDSMGDLFHEGVSDEQIAAVFGVMTMCPEHVFQVLTKRSGRMRRWFSWLDGAAASGRRDAFCMHVAADLVREQWLSHAVASHLFLTDVESWPLPNVWLGTSVEHQDVVGRIDDLLGCEAVVRWISAEPLLGPLDLGERRIDWLVVGGESGSGARRMDLGWARALRCWCRAQGIPFFMKQLGAALATELKVGGKGNDPTRWHEEDRVREWPTMSWFKQTFA